MAAGASFVAAVAAPVHALLFPFPLQGHISPMLQLAKTLASLGITITFLHTHVNLHRSQRLHLPHLHFLSISDGLPADFDRDTNAPVFFASLQNMRPAFEQLLHRLQTEKTELPPVTCIVCDPYFPWVQDVANNCNLPRFIFTTDAAAVFSFYFHLPRLVSEGHLPPIEELFRKGDMEKATISIPGLPPLRVRDFPLADPQISPFFYKLLLSLYQRLGEATGVLLNTFYELERPVFDGLRVHSSVPILPIGPLLPRAFLQKDNDGDAGEGRSLWKEEDCLSWLDLQAPRSVIYVSFGSFQKLGLDEFLEIAMGLLATENPFLWVIRDLPDALPEGLYDRVKERGLLISWSPQLRVLGHSSVGSFFTHCGWNSTIESISMGVPMLCRPLFVDQLTNCRLVVDVWKVGVELAKAKVERREVEKMVRAMMQGEEGEGMRRRVAKLREAARAAVVDATGSSSTNLRAFVRDVERRAKLIF